MNQGQQASPAPQAQPAIAAAPPVLPAPPQPPPVLPAPPAPAAFALGPGRSHTVLDYDDPQQGHSTPRRKVQWGGGQLGRVPGQCARQGTTVYLATPHHGANRRWDNKKLTDPLQASVFGKHQDARNDLRQHTYTRRPRQRHILLFFGRFIDQRLQDNGPALRGRVLGHECASSIIAPQADNHSDEGGQPSIDHAHT